MSKSFIPTSALMSVGIDVVKVIHKQIELSQIGIPEVRYQQQIVVNPNGKRKRALAVDILAEQRAREFFREEFGDDVVVIGEESIDANISPEGAHVFALLDMVDGTDLLEMGIPLWCSALVFYRPNNRRIVGSIIGLASGEIYFASDTEEGALVNRTPNLKSQSRLAEPVAGPSDVKSLETARIAFYGQKAGRLIGLRNLDNFAEKLDEIARKDDPDFRIYNFAGNLMMAKMVDRLRDRDGRMLGRHIDAIFEASGQRVHDVIPGAYIALKAGAHLFDLEGVEISEEELGEKLLRPQERFSYVLSSTHELGQELCGCLLKD